MTSSVSQRRSLWRHRDFFVYWAGDTVSLFGTQITFVALPLYAMLTLDVTASQLGVLRFAEYLPFLVFTLLLGVWADRNRRPGADEGVRCQRRGRKVLQQAHR